MKFKMLVGAVFAAVALAQVAHADTFSDRNQVMNEIRATNPKAKPIQVAWNPGTYNKDTLFFWGNKYWPMSNYMSQKMGRPVSYVPENNRATLLNQIRNQTYKWMYVQPDIAVTAQEFGYMPVAYMTRNSESVFVIPTDSKITHTSDLTGKRIATLAGTNDARLAKYYLHVEGWDANFKDISGGGYPELERIIKAKGADAIAVSRSAANGIVERSNGTLKIFASAGTIPLGVWLAHNSVSLSEINQMVDYMCNSPRDLYLAAGLKLTEQEKPFIPVTKDILKYMRAVMNFNEPDYGRQVYDPRKNLYIEFNTAFSDSQIKPELATPNP